MAGVIREDRILPGYMIKPWFAQLGDVQSSEFYKIFCQEYKEGMNLRLERNLFSFQKLKLWNQLHGFESELVAEIENKAV